MGFKKKAATRSIKPIVYINSPAASDRDDIIGVSSIVESIKEAIKSGARMIGILADFGTGKSSITSMLSSENSKLFHLTNINLWDCLYMNNPGEPDSALRISLLTKTFLYQLASSVTRKNGSSAFAKHIGKKLSRNYSLLSLSIVSAWQWVALVGAAVFYCLYAVLANSSISSLNFILKSASNHTIISRLLIDISPVLLILSIVLVVLCVRGTGIAFSHWKGTEKREPDSNDVFEAYSEVAQKIYIHSFWHNSIEVILVEDLDRINDKQVVVGFLKELYRFQNLMTTTQRKKIAFLISVKPEELLESRKEGSDFVFSKLFDYSIHLKPLQHEDYEEIVLSIISQGAIEKKQQLEKLLGNKSLNGSLPGDFSWIIKGQNLTIRDLKDRLNQTVALRITLENKNYQVYSAISFASCAAVTYLEHQYGKQYHNLIGNEDKFSQIIRKAYSIRNSLSSVIDKTISLRKEFEAIYPENSSEECKAMISDVSNMIINGEIDDDFRMYFYNYPKGKHILNSDEKDLSRLLMLPREYNDDPAVNEKVDRILEANRNDNIITQCINRLVRDAVADYPLVIFQNEYLLNYAIKASKSLFSATITNRLIWSEANYSNCLKCISEIGSFSDKTRSLFLHEYSKPIEQQLTALSTDLLSRVRLELTRVFKKEIVLLRNIYIEQNSNEVTLFPIISEEEITLVSDSSVILELIDTRKISPQSINYILSTICSSALSDVCIKNAEKILEELAFKYSPELIGKFTLAFLDNNEVINNKLFTLVTEWGRLDRNNASSICTYLNSLKIDLPTSYLTLIDEGPIRKGLSASVLAQLEQSNLYTTYLLCMQADKLLHTIDFRNERIQQLIRTTLVEVIDEQLIKDIRLTILKNFKDQLPFYRSLFQGAFPIIDEFETDEVDTMQNVLSLVNVEKVDSENIQPIISSINKRTWYGDDCYTFLKFIFSEQIKSNLELTRSIWTAIDFQQVRYSSMSQSQGEEIVTILKGPLMLDDAKEALEFMRRVECLVASLELIVTDANLANEYVELVNDLHAISEFLLKWIPDQQDAYGFCPEICAALMNSELYFDYILAKTFWDDKFQFDPSIPVKEYVAALKIKKLFDYAKEDETLMHAIIDSRLYDELTPEIIMMLTKCRQPFQLVEKAFEILNEQQLDKYFYAFDHLDTSADSKLLLRYLKTANNFQKLYTGRIRYIVREKLWESGDRQSLTKFLKKHSDAEHKI